MVVLEYLFLQARKRHHPVRVFSMETIMAVQQYRLEPSVESVLVIQLPRFFTKSERHLLKQVVRFILAPTFLQA
jgi:hypothetical protein